MLGKQVVCAVLSGMILAAATSGALACKGSTVLLKDDFSKVNKGWRSVFAGSSFSIAGGKMVGGSPQGKITVVRYEGGFFNDADFCADVVLQQVDDQQNKWAGIMLEAGPWYFGHLTFDGAAGVSEATSDGWLSPIPDNPFDAMKTDPGAVNTLRMVWKSTEPTVSFYVNDKLVDTLDVPPSRGRKIGFVFATEGDPKGIVEFRNVLVTKP